SHHPDVVRERGRDLLEAREPRGADAVVVGEEDAGVLGEHGVALCRDIGLSQKRVIAWIGCKVRGIAMGTHKNPAQPPSPPGGGNKIPTSAKAGEGPLPPWRGKVSRGARRMRGADGPEGRRQKDPGPHAVSGTGVGSVDSLARLSAGAPCIWIVGAE